MLYMGLAPNLGSEPPICELPLLITNFHTFTKPKQREYLKPSLCRPSPGISLFFG